MQTIVKIKAKYVLLAFLLVPFANSQSSLDFIKLNLNNETLYYETSTYGEISDKIISIVPSVAKSSDVYPKILEKLFEPSIGKSTGKFNLKLLESDKQSYTVFIDSTESSVTKDNNHKTQFNGEIKFFSQGKFQATINSVFIDDSNYAKNSTEKRWANEWILNYWLPNYFPNLYFAKLVIGQKYNLDSYISAAQPFARLHTHGNIGLRVGCIFSGFKNGKYEFQIYQKSNLAGVSTPLFTERLEPVMGSGRITFDRFGRLFIFESNSTIRSKKKQTITIAKKTYILTSAYSRFVSNSTKLK